MIYLLVDRWYEWLHAHGLGFLRVFLSATFQVTAAILFSFLICILLGPKVIAWLRKQKIGDDPSFDQAEMDKLMAGKKGVPTMGGLLIILSIVTSTLLLADLHNFYVEMALLCLVWLGMVGATDDWLKLTAGRRSGSRQGLTGLEKILFQIGLSVLLAYFTFNYDRNTTHSLYFPFLKSAGFPLSRGMFILIATVVMTGSSNAVNLTDGLDGLASGCMAIVSFAFCILALIVGTRPWATELLIPYVQKTDQMAVLAGCMVGACLGFLWFNCNPASVFMGDTGSLALGGLIGYIAIVVRQELVLFLVGGIFVMEAVSVILQVGYFKYTRKRFGEGRRIFLMSPLHHHFQRKGWTETQVVVRFWLIGAMLAAMALATVKLR
jgi:phospho-N-acetylmuramoyl-pentapeptide-transferase